jgi:type VI secretion system protein VasJ
MDLLSLGKNPVNATQPAGADARNDPRFKELQAEIDKLSLPSAIDPTD